MIRRMLVSGALILVTGYMTLLVYARLQLRRARLLVIEVKELPVGLPIPKQPEAGFTDLRCVPDWGCYKAVSNLPFVDFFASPRRLPAKLTPSRWWGVIVRIGLDASGNIVEKDLAVDDGHYHQFGTVEIRVRRDSSWFDP